MQLNELKTGDLIVARYGSEYREMDVLSNDTERQQLTVDIKIKIGMLDEMKRLEVLKYSDYNLESWGYIKSKEV